MTTSIEEQRLEFERAMKAIQVHSKALAELDSKTDALHSSVDLSRLSPLNVGSTMLRLIEGYTTIRATLAKSRAVVASDYFDNAALKDLQGKLVVDLDQAEKYLEVRTDFLRTMLADNKAAIQQAELLRSNLDGKRYNAEANARRSAVDIIAERVRRTHNDEVTKANAQLSMHRSKSKLAVASWAYVGGYIGGMIGWIHWRWRRRKAKSAPIATNAPEATPD